MKKQLFVIALFSVLFVACENDKTVIETPENTEEVETEQTEVVAEEFVGQEVNVIATHIAVFEIEGMMCQKGCGSIIRKGLHDTGGGSEVEVAFEDENPVNEIRVYFDKKNTSIEDMISVIGKLADNRYNAKLISISESTLSKS